MKILYLSVHEILEYDEIKLFTEMGHEVFSMGAYMSSNRGGEMRGEIPDLYQNEALKVVGIQSSKHNLHPELIAWADVVISMHNSKIPVFPLTDKVLAEYANAPEQPWIANNWHMLKDKRTIWRSIGQSTHNIEIELQKYKQNGMQIVRYSPKERNIPAYCGENAMIRFYKDPEEFKGWTGEENTVINFTQSLKKRGDHCGYLTFMKGTEGLNRKVYGPGNEDLGAINGGVLTYEEQKKAYQRAGCYFYYGTAPASYTLTLIEAMMTGIPVVAAGPSFSMQIYQQATNEISDIIQNGRNGYVGNSVSEIHDYIEDLLEDKEKAKEMGENGRRTAIQLFAKNKIRQEWTDFLENG